MRVLGLGVRREGVVRVRARCTIIYFFSHKIKLLNFRPTYSVPVFWHFKVRIYHRRAIDGPGNSAFADVGNSGILV